MLIDYEGLFSDDQAITGDAPSTNLIDLQVARGIGTGNPVKIRVSVTAAFNNLTSLEILFQTDDSAAFSSAKEVGSSGDILAAALVAGAYFDFYVPAAQTERFLRLSYDVTGTNPSTGKLHAAIVADFQHMHA